MNRPKQRNALSLAHLLDLQAALDRGRVERRPRDRPRRQRAGLQLGPRLRRHGRRRPDGDAPAAADLHRRDGPHPVDAPGGDRPGARRWPPRPAASWWPPATSPWPRPVGRLRRARRQGRLVLHDTAGGRRPSGRPQAGVGARPHRRHHRRRHRAGLGAGQPGGRPTTSSTPPWPTCWVGRPGGAPRPGPSASRRSTPRSGWTNPRRTRTPSRSWPPPARPPTPARAWRPSSTSAPPVWD